MKHAVVFGLICLLALPVWADCVKDDQHTEICLNEAKRVVTLAPHATELIAHLGGQDRLVGVDNASDYPPVVSGLPEVGDAQRLDLETVLALKPDLVVAWGSGTSPASIQTLRDLGLPVFVSEPLSIKDVAANMVRLGRLLGNPRANQIAANWLAQFETLRHSSANQSRPRVLYQVWQNPLMVIGGKHLINELIEVCGGVNVFGHLKALAPTVSLEAAVAGAPEVILTSGPNGDVTLAHWRQWSNMPAVRTQSLVSLPPDVLVRAGPRLLQGAYALCEAVATAQSAEVAR